MGKDNFQMVLLGSVLIKNHENKYLLVQEAKDKKYSKCKDKWTLPHGGYDKLNESIEDLAKRELQEETGFSCTLTGRYVCIEGYSLLQNRLIVVNIVFEGKDAVKVQEPWVDEIKDMKYFSLEEICTMLREGQIRDDLPIDKIVKSFYGDGKGIIRWELKI